MPLPVRASNREGFGWKREDLDKWLIAGGNDWTMLEGRPKHTKPTENGQDYYIMSDVDKAYEKANEVIEKAQDAYNTILGRFRSTIKNDLSSISASSDRVTKEVIKMGEQYQKAISTMNSPEMERAIVNAERLASALATIATVQAANISFTLMDNKD